MMRHSAGGSSTLGPPMASLDSLPADQRAVLQLVLQRGRSYDEIARLLSIDRAAVRERAVAAFDALGPQTGLSDERRELITDYLLGQLSPSGAEQARDQLAESPSERAWARVLASELAPLASGGLPEIPVEASSSRAQRQAPEPAAEAHPPVSAGTAAASEPGVAEPSAPATGRRSRLGGSILILAAVIAVAVVVVILLSSGGSGGKKAANPAASGTSTTPATSTAAGSSTTGTASTPAKVVAQINLTPPTAGSKAAGIAEVLRQGTTDGIAIVAQHVPPNTTKPPNAYAVWLYNSRSDSHILGFVNPGVTSSGKLSTAGGLPANASHYKQLIVTVETKAHPKAPGTVVLQGALNGV
ncbi:MAG: RNA polymerase sigma factor [Solirubrobacteraceae bacterium]